MKKIAFIIILVFLLPLIAKSQGALVYDNTNYMQNLSHYGKAIAEMTKQIDKLEDQYKNMKKRYELARDQVNKLKKVSYAVIDFVSADAVIKSLKDLQRSINNCGKAFFENPYISAEIKRKEEERIIKMAEDKAYALQQLELANQVDGVELTDKERIDLVNKSIEEARILQARLDRHNAALDNIVVWINQKKGFERASETIRNFSLWD